MRGRDQPCLRVVKQMTPLLPAVVYLTMVNHAGFSSLPPSLQPARSAPKQVQPVPNQAGRCRPGSSTTCLQGCRSLKPQLAPIIGRSQAQLIPALHRCVKRRVNRTWGGGGREKKNLHQGGKKRNDWAPSVLGQPKGSLLAGCQAPSLVALRMPPGPASSIHWPSNHAQNSTGIHGTLSFNTCPVQRANSAHL